MSVGEIAGLIAAVAFVALVAALVIPLLKIGKTVDEVTRTVQELREEHVGRTAHTVDETNELLTTTNTQLQKVDAITTNAKTVTENAAAMSALFAATLGGPVVRVAAFSYGVRRALSNRWSSAGRDRRQGRWSR